LEDEKFIDRCNEIYTASRAEISRDREYRKQLKATRERDARKVRNLSTNLAGDYASAGPCRISQASLRTLVGAPGFEPGASCAQDRIASLAKLLVFNHAVENKPRCFVEHMCGDVCTCSRLIVGSLQKSLQFLLLGVGSAS
jgi:hypothetical protein